MLEFRLLGSIECVRDGSPVALGGPRQVCLLAYLLLHANEPVSQDRLLEALWSDDGRPVRRLSVAIARLRRSLGDVPAPGPLRTLSGGYVLDVAPGSLDARVFREKVAYGRRVLADGNPEGAGELLRDALALWRGPPLADLAYTAFAQPEIALLSELHLSAIEARVEADLRNGFDASLIPELEALVGEHPTREHLAGQLILALYRADRQVDALEAYQRVRTRLVDDFGLEPGRSLRELQARVLAQSPSLEHVPAPAPAVEAVAPPRSGTEGATEPPRDEALIGRDDEMARLEAHMQGAWGGGLRVVVVSGPAGIGKTRLLRELNHRAEEHGLTPLYGGGDEDGALPYQPFVEALRTYIAASIRVLHDQGLDGELAELARLMPDDQLGAPRQPPRDDGELERFRLFQAVAAVISHAATDRPAVVLLDDLQWADRATRQMLRHVVRAARRSRLLLVLALREESLADFVSGLRREWVVDHIALGGLARADAIEFVRGELPSVSPSVLDAIAEETGGNPLFLAEMTRTIRAVGPDMDRLRLDQVDVPDGVKALVAQRARDLSHVANAALRAAAVIGVEFELTVVEKSCALTTGASLDAIDEALGAGIVCERPGRADGFAFSHALVRKALYRELSASRRARLHLAVGTAMESLGNRHPAELAQHFWEARHIGGAERAVRYLAEAGRRADDALAWEESQRQYGLALEALEITGRVEPGLRGELMLAYGDALERSGESLLAKGVVRPHGRVRTYRRRQRAPGTCCAGVRAGTGRRLRRRPDPAPAPRGGPRRDRRL